MPKFIDQAGKRFGRLFVLKHAGRNKSLKQMWLCKCDCGNEKIVCTPELNRGSTLSCGCLLKEKITKHGGYKKSSYNTWKGMMRRCNNPKDKDYFKYGGAGIKVDPRWFDYVNFVADMGEPTGNDTLDRIDPYGNYTPTNCRWASLPTQARNRRLGKNNQFGHVGITKTHNNKWIAKITKGKKAFYSKVTETFEEAIAERKILEQKYWGVA